MIKYRVIWVEPIDGVEILQDFHEHGMEHGKKKQMDMVFVLKITKFRISYFRIAGGCYCV